MDGVAHWLQQTPGDAMVVIDACDTIMQLVSKVSAPAVAGNEGAYTSSPGGWVVPKGTDEVIHLLARCGFATGPQATLFNKPVLAGVQLQHLVALMQLAEDQLPDEVLLAHVCPPFAEVGAHAHACI